MSMHIQTILTHASFKRSSRWKIATVAFALVVLGSASVVVGSRAQAAADEQALKKVVLDAFTAPSSLVVIPGQSEELSVQLPSAASAAIENSRGHAKQVLTTIYDPDCQVCQNIKNGIDNSIAAQAKGRFRALGAGIKDIEWRHVAVDGDAASVTLAATVWSKVKFRDEFNKVTVVTPTAGFVYVYTLKKVGGNWVVTSQLQDDVAANELPVNKLRPGKDATDDAPPPGQVKPAKGPRVTPFKTK